MRKPVESHVVHGVLLDTSLYELDVEFTGHSDVEGCGEYGSVVEFWVDGLLENLVVL